jgi:hypothetical protein
MLPLYTVFCMKSITAAIMVLLQGGTHMSENLTDRPVQIGRWQWNLKYSRSALIIIQRHAGGLQKLAMKLIEGGGLQLTNPLPDDMAALLIWAGESWRAPKLTMAKVQKRIAELNGVERTLLSAWAAGKFLIAVLELMEAQVDKALPATDDDYPGYSQTDAGHCGRNPVAGAFYVPGLVSADAALWQREFRSAGVDERRPGGRRCVLVGRPAP